MTPLFSLMMLWLPEMRMKQSWMIATTDCSDYAGRNSNPPEARLEIPATTRERAGWAVWSDFGHTHKNMRAVSYVSCVFLYPQRGGGG